MTPPTPQLDSSLALLAAEHRRCCLVVLDAERTIDVTALAERIDRRTARDGAEFGDSVLVPDEDSLSDSDPDPDQVRTIRTALYHVHLPKLADAGLVSYGPDSSTVSVPEDSIEEVERLAAIVRRARDDSSRA